jgi:hypothetical protein
LNFYERNIATYIIILHLSFAYITNAYACLCRCLELEASCGDGSGGMARSFSANSLIDDETFETVEDIAGYYEAQRNQTFIGMTTLQYQARQVR